MYGKFFASAFTGSMYGAGPDVFAVWAYVIANTNDSQVELNPILLAGTLGTTRERVQSAIEFLCAPDPQSRSKAEDGRRLVREGEYAYRVPTFAAYRAIRNEEERREYNRIKQAEHRAKKRAVKAPVIDSQSLSSASANAVAVAVTEVEVEKTRARFVDPFHLDGYDHYRAAHGSPVAYDRTLTKLAARVGWPTVGQTLFEMEGAGARFSIKALEAFAAKLVPPTPTYAPGHINLPEPAPCLPACALVVPDGGKRGVLTHAEGCPNA